MNRPNLLRGAALGAAILLITALPLRAQTQDENRAACQSTDPDTSIAGCSADIASGQEATPGDLAIAYYNRGNAYKLKLDYESAIADYSKAISLNPNDTNYYDERGVAYQRLNRTNEAIADYRAVLNIDPNDEMAQNNLAVLGAAP
jgi:tetratricopeptide (TPR) repeat protein